MAEKLYVWKDLVTGKIVNIYRPMDLYKLEPDINEAKTAGLSTDEYDNAKWERLIQAPMVTNKWPSTTGAVKGKP